LAAARRKRWPAVHEWRRKGHGTDNVEQRTKKG
jgi:hypothetical protein